MKINTIDHYPATIVTTKRSICRCIYDCDDVIVENAVYCTEKCADYELRLWYVCYTLQWLSKMYYRTKTGEYKKLTANRYYERVFKGFGETREEINSIYPVREGGYEKLQIVFRLWSHFLANEYESTFVEEFAYAYEYVMAHDDLPAPEFEWSGALYPNNYSDYNVNSYRRFDTDYFRHIPEME